MYAEDMVDMDASSVGARHAVPSDVGDSRASESPTHHSCYGDGAPGLPSGDAVFDPAALHAQLADLLQIYLQRASQPDAVEECSAKDALACAKTATEMMSALQAGKLAAV